jgi:hypothetical protein
LRTLGTTYISPHEINGRINVDYVLESSFLRGEEGHVNANIVTFASGTLLVC